MSAPKPIECEIVDAAYRRLHCAYVNSTACLFLAEHRKMAECWAWQLANAGGADDPERRDDVVHNAAVTIADALHARFG